MQSGAKQYITEQGNRDRGTSEELPRSTQPNRLQIGLPPFFIVWEFSRDFSAICSYNAKSYSYLAQDLDQVARHAHCGDISTSTCALYNQRIAAVPLGVEANNVV